MDAGMYRELRPRRNIVKPCLDYNQVLLREEEQALRKALYVSLRDKKHESGKSLEYESHISENYDMSYSVEFLDQEKATRLQKKQHGRSNKRSRRIQKRKKRHNCLDDLNETKSVYKETNINPDETEETSKKSEQSISGEESEKSMDANFKIFLKEVGCTPNYQSEVVDNGHLKDCNGLSNVGFTMQAKQSSPENPEMSRRTLQAQRKFAQSQPCSPNSLQIQRMGISIPERPKTEDFIKFLCLRGTTNLPKELEYFNEPICPSSPLSSEEDEFLPLSPFFKRQDDSPVKVNKNELFTQTQNDVKETFSIQTIEDLGKKLNRQSKITSTSVIPISWF